MVARGGRAVVKAFDTGPANLLLDQAVQRLTDGRRMYNRNGALAAKGTVAEDWWFDGCAIRSSI